MTLITRSVTNNSSSTINIFIPGADANHAPVTVAPSATLDLLSAITEDELEAIQGQLASLVSKGIFSVTATVDTATFESGYTGSAIWGNITGTLSSQTDLQTALNAKKAIATGNNYKFETTSATGNLQETSVTSHSAVATDANGLPVASSTTDTELGYVHGVTSAIQTQLNTKAPTASPTFTGTVTVPIEANTASQTTLTGSVGTAVCSEPQQGSSWKKVVVYLNGYTDTGTQIYTYPTAFSHTPFVSGLAAGVSGATASTTTVTFTVTTQTGFVFIEGF